MYLKLISISILSSIPFSAASSATPSRSTFSLTYITDNGSIEELKLKLNRQRLSASLYRTITEKHAFYSCETVCSDVTKQFIRDLKVRHFISFIESQRN